MAIHSDNRPSTTKYSSSTRRENTMPISTSASVGMPTYSSVSHCCHSVHQVVASGRRKKNGKSRVGRFSGARPKALANSYSTPFRREETSAHSPSGSHCTAASARPPSTIAAPLPNAHSGRGPGSIARKSAYAPSASASMSTGCGCSPSAACAKANPPTADQAS